MFTPVIGRWAEAMMRFVKANKLPASRLRFTAGIGDDIIGLATIPLIVAIAPSPCRTVIESASISAPAVGA